MSVTLASGIEAEDGSNTEKDQLYHNALKDSGDVSVEVAGSDQDGEDMARMGRKGELQVRLNCIGP